MARAASRGGLSALTWDSSTSSGQQRAVSQLALEGRDTQTDRSRHPGQTETSRRDDGSREAARDFMLRAATLCSDPEPQFPHLKGENFLHA